MPVEDKLADLLQRVERLESYGYDREFTRDEARRLEALRFAANMMPPGQSVATIREIADQIEADLAKRQPSIAGGSRPPAES